MRIAAAAVLVLALAVPGAHAQSVGAPVAPGVATSDLDTKLTRLLELLGSVQFLRRLCDPGETMRWRERAAELIEAEAEGIESRREELTAAFNRGYRAFGTYRTCTDNAVFALDRFTVEGEALLRDVLVRYGE